MTIHTEPLTQLFLGMIDHADEPEKVLQLSAMGLRIVRSLDEPEPDVDRVTPPIDTRKKAKNKPSSKIAEARNLQTTTEQKLAVVCPRCDAQPGERCWLMTRGKHSKRVEPPTHVKPQPNNPTKEFHPARRQAAREAVTWKEAAS